VRRAITNGASDYLMKPFRPDKLILRAERLLRSVRSLGGELDRQVA
jgi:DNA-binding response OmpR family regulator